MASPPVSDLTSHLGYWLRMVSNHVSHAFAARLAARDVTVAEWALLRMLHDRPPTAPSTVADAMGMTRGAITKLADRLIAKALVRREADAADGRAQTLALTRRGRELVPALAALADDNDAEVFGCLSAADRRALERLLRTIAQRRNLSTIPLD
jgi:DNA-binding MarR family transcriptional regulator